MKKLKTLILEDDMVSRLILEYYCLNHPDIDYKVTFEDTLEAVAFLEKEEVDLILLDIQLKNTNGFDLLPYLPTGTHVIVTTGKMANMEKAMGLQLSEILMKPIKLEEFLYAVEKIKSKINGTPASL